MVYVYVLFGSLFGICLILGGRVIVRHHAVRRFVRGICQRTESAGERGAVILEETKIDKPRKSPRVSAIEMQQVRSLTRDAEKAVAQSKFDEAERLYTTDFSPNVRPVAAMRARLYAGRGRLKDALDWVREQKLTAADDPNYLREFEHITLARILLARYRRGREPAILSEASSLLDRLVEAAEAGGRARSAIEIRILQALSQQEQGNAQAALRPLEQALTLAEAQGFVRMFVDEGAPMERLLREATLRNHYPDYTRRLLAVFAADHQQGSKDEANRPAASTSSARNTRESQPATPALVEPLSQRELEVLRLFRTELSGPDIARELMVALSTVRTHTKSIYGKLNVNSRRAAVRRALELKLI